jgi:hypothetical protein
VKISPRQGMSYNKFAKGIVYSFLLIKIRIKNMRTKEIWQEKIQWKFTAS